jgi:alkylation response protein AidB-like acyl-CoA dehydrogenase
MDWLLSAEQRQLQDTVRKLMQKHGSPDYVRDLDRTGSYPYALYDAWVEAGLFALPFPEELGGVGGDITDLVVVAQEIARSSADLFMAFGGSVFCGMNILRKGTEEQRNTWIPKIIAGEVRMAISISEPEAGSDVAALRAKAERQGDHYVVNGQKLWCSGAGAKNTLLNVYLRTDPNVSVRKGVSLLLIDNDTPGVELRKLDMLGRRCMGTYEVNFVDAQVPADRVVGGENQGWDCLLAGLQAERIVSAAGSCGAAEACVELANSYAQERKQFGRPIGSNQAIAHMLADMQTDVAAAKALTWTAALKLQAGQDALAEISMAKLLASETYVKVANQGMQIFGAYGYSMEFDMQRHYRDSRASTVAAGSSQMLRNIIAGLGGNKVA